MVRKQQKRFGSLFSLLLILCLVAGSLTPAAPAREAQAADTTDAPKNVIILISDGMGYNHMDAASYYQYGDAGQQVYEQFPIQLAMSTYEADDEGYDPDQAWSNPGYVQDAYTDSASAATTMSTGVKTYNGAIGMGPDRNLLKHLFEYAEEQGKMSGVVSSVQLSHATPAGFVAHNVARGNYAEIAREMIYTSAVDVIMGAGHPTYDDSSTVLTNTADFEYKYVGGEDTWNDLTDADGAEGADANGDGTPDTWTLIQDESEFAALAADPNPPSRVIGVPKVYQTLQFNRSGDSTVPYDVPFNTNVPTLTLMTSAALNVLDEDSDGFMLMVEGGAVDWAGHANHTARLIEEQIDFNHSVEAVVAWVEDSTNGSSWDDTLVIVTADHETGFLLGPDSCPGDEVVAFNPLDNNGAGTMPGVQWCNKVEGGYANHTNSLIPFFAKGKGAEYFRYYADQNDPVRGAYIDNTEIAKLIIAWLTSQPLPPAPPKPEPPKNVIILISDGMGYNHMDATSYYQYGELGHQVYESFPYKFGMSTYEVDDQGYNPQFAWTMPGYVQQGYTDSAAAATAMSTGVKTYNGAIGMGPDRNLLKHLFEYAEEQGKMSGVVSSVQLSHATPAGFVAHNVARGNYAEIAREMIYTSAVDVIMGAGHPTYDDSSTVLTNTADFEYKYVGGEDTWNDLTDADGAEGADANGDGTPDTWTLIQDESEFAALAADPNPPSRVIGVPKVYQTLQFNRSGDSTVPYDVPFNTNVPTLTLMTSAALNVLDEDSDGFMLMVEGGAVDWAGHANHTARLIEEQIDFNHSVEAVVAWVEDSTNGSSWDDTLVIVTADHETGFLLGPDSCPGDTTVALNPIVNNDIGNMPGVQWCSGSHTNSIIPFFAKGKGSRYFEYLANKIDPERGRYIDNTDISRLIFEWDEITAKTPAWMSDGGVPAQPASDPVLRILGTHETGLSGAAEIAGYDWKSQRLFITNSDNQSFTILDISNPAAPVEVSTVNLAPLNANYGSPTSVASAHGLVAVAVAHKNEQLNGFVVFFDSNGNRLKHVRAGALPDMLTFTHDGMRVLVANEGEPNEDYTTDPEGSVSVVDLSGGVENLTQADVTILSFADFNAGGPLADNIDPTVRIFGPGATVAQDLEPEYITVSEDDTMAWVTLQENNAVAIIDLTTDPTFTEIVSLGFKNHSLPGYGMDASDKDGMINIQTWPVWGMYQPDAIASFMAGGETFFVTANEGDSREYNAFDEEARIKDLTLASDVFTSAAELQDKNALGRLKTTTTLGDPDGDGEYEQLFSYGARSFSVWTADGKLVFDSGDDFEQITAAMYPAFFNDEGEPGDFDSRSDAKGPEPEGITTGTVNGRPYAFVGLERIGGVMVYDLSNPGEPTFVQYINNRPTDIAPEGLLFVPARQSPTGSALLVVTNEESGSTTIYSVGAPETPTVQFGKPSFGVAEAAGTATISVTLSTTSTNSVTVDYLTIDGDAIEGSDYTTKTGQVSFAPGTIHQTISIPILDDSEAEISEHLYVTLSNPTNATLGMPDIATLTIEDDDSTFNLRIMHTNDHHAHLEPDDRSGLGGIARRLTLVNQLRQQSEQSGESTLLLDAGDVFQGTLYFNEYEGMADLWFYNRLRYDAMAVGNHEFDKGPDALNRFIDGDTVDVGSEQITVQGATFPLLSANMEIGPTSVLSGKIKPWSIVEVDGEKIGIIGLTTPETSILSSPGAKISFTDPISAAQQAVSELQAQNVNKIVALTHQGFTVDQELARQVDGLDIIVGGHSHTQLGPGHDDPYPVEMTTPDGGTVLFVSDYEWGKYLGNIHLSFNAQGEIVAWGGLPIPVDDTIPDDPWAALWIEKFSKPIDDLRNEVIGEAGVFLDGERNNVRSRETNLANLITDAMLERVRSSGAQVALTNGGGIRASIEAGDVTVGDVITVLPFGNTIALVDLTGEQIRDALENGVSQVESGAGRFPQVAGMRYTWTISNTPGSRIVTIEVADDKGNYHPIDEDETYRLATNNYMLGGGDGYSVLTEGTNQYDTGYLMADVVIEYIRANSPVSPTVEGRIAQAVPTAEKIHTIQGPGNASPMKNALVTIEGVVVGDFQGGDNLTGFFVQEEDGDTDNNPATSEGIFVYDGQTGVDVNVGDAVRITGMVDEYYDLTELTNVSSIEVLAESWTTSMVTVTLPVSDVADLERYEGMWVTMPQELTVSENYNLGRYGETVLSAGRLWSPTNVAEPGPASDDVAEANKHRRIILDDGSNRQNPDPVIYPSPELSTTNTLRAGDSVAGLTGVMSYGFNEYRIHATETPTFTHTNPRPTAPEPVGGTLRVASFNVLNYFNGDGQGGGFPTPRGANTMSEFQRQRDKIIPAILDLNADVIGLMEIENDGYGPDSAIQDLVNGLNKAVPGGGNPYAFVDPGLPQLGSDEIAVALIYRTDRVTVAGTAATTGTGSFADKNRQPLVQTFEDNASGEQFTVVVNHFKSKGSGCGDGDDDPIQGNCNGTRTQAARDLVAWLNTYPTGINDPDILIIGDLNAYAKEDPIKAITDAGYANLVETFVGQHAYSYVYYGQAGYLDHALASASLAPNVTGTTIWHINADEPRVLDYNEEYQSARQVKMYYKPDPYRASDHDPVIVGLQLGIVEGDRLTLLHNNDGESSLEAIPYTVDAGGEEKTLPVGGVAAFKTLTMQQITEARSAGHAVVNVYAGDAFLASSTLACSLDNPDAPIYDAVAQRQIPYTAHILGNHEFDYSPDFLERFIRAFEVGGALTQPFLSANLDFSGEANYANLTDADGLIFDPVTDGRVIGHALVYTDTQTGQVFGIVGLTTPDLPTISTPRNVAIAPDTVKAVQDEIDRIHQRGINKIILVSHMQSVENDRMLVHDLKGVDLVVAGGGDELLISDHVDESKQRLPGEGAETYGSYPMIEQDADGRDVYIVTTAGNYKYLGRMDVVFDANGEVAQVIKETSYARRVIPQGEVATDLGLTDTVQPDQNIVDTVITPVAECKHNLANEIVARSEVELDVSRGTVRTRESNAGNMIADGYRWHYDQYAANVGLPPRSSSNYVVGLTNGGGIRQNAGDTLPTGTATPADGITRDDTLNVLPFNNFLTVVSDVTPANVKAIFERSAASLPYAGGQFLQVSGITVTYHISETVGNRVIEVLLEDGTAIVEDGEVVAGAPNIRIVTNSFTASGGDDYTTFASNSNKTQLLDANGLTISYERGWRDYLKTFPVQEGYPTVPVNDPRYQPGGEGRILVLRSHSLPTDREHTVESHERVRGFPRVRIEIPASVVTTTEKMTITYRQLAKHLRPLVGKRALFFFRLLMRNHEGQPITKFAKPIIIVLRYTDAELRIRGITESAETLTVVYWDENQQQWVAIGPSDRCPQCGMQNVDTTNNEVTILVDHLTDFAFSGAVETTAGNEVFLPIIMR